MVKNHLENCYASIKGYEVYSGNPAPWKIIEVRIDKKYSRDGWEHEWVVRIRGEHTCWWNANSCYIDENPNEVQEWVDHETRERIKKNILTTRVEYIGAADSEVLRDYK